MIGREEEGKGRNCGGGEENKQITNKRRQTKTDEQIRGKVRKSFDGAGGRRKKGESE